MSRTAKFIKINHERTYSYRHGFKAGRNDVMPDGEGPFYGMSNKRILLEAEEAMRKDEQL